MTSGAPASAPVRVYRCPPAARWLPYALGGAVLAASTLVYLDLDPGRPMAGTVRAAVLAAGALLSLGILRGGAETRLGVSLRGDAVRWESRAGSVELAVADVEILDWDPVLRSLSRWPPALVLVDRSGRRFRIPACLTDGPRLVEELLGRSARESLRAWADARRVAERMAHSRVWVALGWVLASALLAAALVFSATRPSGRAIHGDGALRGPVPATAHVAACAGPGTCSG